MLVTRASFILYLLLLFLLLLLCNMRNLAVQRSWTEQTQKTSRNLLMFPVLTCIAVVANIDTHNYLYNNNNKNNNHTNTPKPIIAVHTTHRPTDVRCIDHDNLLRGWGWKLWVFTLVDNGRAKIHSDYQITALVPSNFRHQRIVSTSYNHVLLIPNHYLE